MAPPPSTIIADETEQSEESSSASDDDEIMMDEIPEEFICPLTLCIMRDPVVSKDGKNYDRKAILQWLAKGNENCPLTRQPLHLSSLIPNHNLRQSIQQWKQDRGLGKKTSNSKYAMDMKRSYRDLASLGLVLEFSDDMMQSRHQQQQQQLESPAPSQGVSDLLALYDEILELTEGGVPSGNKSSNELEALVDAELRDIKDMFDEIVELGQATGTQSA
jgi:U-box domain